MTSPETTARYSVPRTSFVHRKMASRGGRVSQKWFSGAEGAGGAFPPRVLIIVIHDPIVHFAFPYTSDLFRYCEFVIAKRWFVRTLSRPTYTTFQAPQSIPSSTLRTGNVAEIREALRGTGARRFELRRDGAFRRRGGGAVEGGFRARCAPGQAANGHRVCV